MGDHPAKAVVCALECLIAQDGERLKCGAAEAVCARYAWGCDGVLARYPQTRQTLDKTGFGQDKLDELLP